MGSLFVFWGSRGIIQPLEGAKAFFAAFARQAVCGCSPKRLRRGET